MNKTQHTRESIIQSGEYHEQAKRLNRQLDETKAQRDELLAACKALLVAADCGHHIEALERSNPLCTQFARTAIARVKGKAQS